MDQMSLFGDETFCVSGDGLVSSGGESRRDSARGKSPRRSTGDSELCQLAFDFADQMCVEEGVR